MKTTYLLPCACGEKLQVDASESGLTMKCRCGASLEVPALRGLSRLEKVVVEEPAAARPAWGGGQRGIAVGALIAVLGLGIALFWTVKPLPRPEDVFDDDEMQRLGLGRNEEALFTTPRNVMTFYIAVQQQGLFPGDAKLVERYRQELQVQVWWRFAGYLLTALGLLVVGISTVVLLIRRSRAHGPHPMVSASA